MQAAGKRKGAEGLEGLNGKSGAVPGLGHPKSLPPVMAQCSSSSLAASEQGFSSALQWHPWVSWGFSVGAPVVSLNPFPLPSPTSEAQLHAAVLLWEMVRAAWVKAETPRMAHKCPMGWDMSS